jgi:hypothetical protein
MGRRSLLASQAIRSQNFGFRQPLALHQSPLVWCWFFYLSLVKEKRISKNYVKTQISTKTGQDQATQ